MDYKEDYKIIQRRIEDLKQIEFKYNCLLRFIKNESNRNYFDNERLLEIIKILEQEIENNV